MQDMQHKLNALSEKNGYLKQNQFMSASPNNDVASVASSTMMNQQQNAFYQQMIAASKAQQAFYQKSDLSSSNVKFPKFSGKSTSEFITWYHQVLSIIAIPSW